MLGMLSAPTSPISHWSLPLSVPYGCGYRIRAGLDYHDLAHVKVHSNFEDALAEVPGHIWAFTGHASDHYSEVHYADGDGLLFGRESVGLPEWAMTHPRITQCVRIQMLPGVRSLNLANSASIALYEAWRQLGFPNGI